MAEQQPSTEGLRCCGRCQGEMCQQCTVTTNKANCLLSCIRRKVARSCKEAEGRYALQQGYNSLIFTILCLSPPWMLSSLSSDTSIAPSLFVQEHKAVRSKLPWVPFCRFQLHLWLKWRHIYILVCFWEFPPLPLSLLPHTAEACSQPQLNTKGTRNVRQLLRCSEK